MRKDIPRNHWKFEESGLFLLRSLLIIARHANVEYLYVFSLVSPPHLYNTIPSTLKGPPKSRSLDFKFH